MRTNRRLPTLAGLLAAGLLLAGCAAGGNDSPETSPGSPSATDETVVVGDTGPTGDTTDGADDGDAPGDATGAGPAAGSSESEPAPDPLTCLHGEWLADNESFLASLREFGDEPTSVTGEVTLTFAPDGSVTTRYDAWRITMAVEGHEAVIIRDGTDEGTFTADEGRVSIHETHMGSALTMSTAGMDMTIAPEPAVYSDAQYTCTARDASISTPDGTVLLSRITG